MALQLYMGVSKHYTWMSQEGSTWLGSVGYKPNISHLEVVYNPLIPTIDPNFQQDIQVKHRG